MTPTQSRSCSYSGEPPGSKRATNVLLISLADLGTSGGEAVTTVRLARALSDEGFSVRVLAPRNDTAEPVVAPGDVEICYHRNITKLGLPNSLNTLVQLCSIIWHPAYRHCELLYVRSAMLTSLFGLYGRLRRQLVVVSEHHGWTEEERANGGRYTWLKSIEKHAQVLDARLARRVRTVVPGIRTRLEANGVPRGRVKVIGNACDTQTIFPIARTTALAEMGLDEGALYLGFIGNLAPWQGLRTVVDAMRYVVDEEPLAQLLIAGDGPERAGLEQQIRQLDLNDHVRFLGRVEHARIHRVVGCFDLAVMPTENRGYAEIGRSPLKLREYAAAGRAILAADIPGVRDYDKHTWLSLYAPGDARDFAQAAVRQLRDRPALAANGAAARVYAETNFSWQVVTRRLIAELELCPTSVSTRVAQ